MEKVGASLTASTSENATPAKEYVLLPSFSSFSSSSIASALRFFDAAGVAFFFLCGLFFGVTATFCFFTKKSLIDVNVEIVAVLLARSSTSTSEIVPLSKSTCSLESSNILSATGGVSVAADASPDSSFFSFCTLTTEAVILRLSTSNFTSNRFLEFQSVTAHPDTSPLCFTISATTLPLLVHSIALLFLLSLFASATSLNEPACASVFAQINRITASIIASCAPSIPLARFFSLPSPFARMVALNVKLLISSVVAWYCMRFLFDDASLSSAVIVSSPHKTSTPVHVHKTCSSVGASSKTSVISYIFSTPHFTSPDTTSKILNFWLSSPIGNLFNTCFSTINACFASNVFLLAKSFSSSFCSCTTGSTTSVISSSPPLIFFFSFSRSSFHFCIVATFLIPSTRSKQSNPPLHNTSKLAGMSNIGALAQVNR